MASVGPSFGRTVPHPHQVWRGALWLHVVYPCPQARCSGEPPGPGGSLTFADLDTGCSPPSCACNPLSLASGSGPHLRSLSKLCCCCGPGQLISSEGLQTYFSALLLGTTSAAPNSGWWFMNPELSQVRSVVRGTVILLGCCRTGSVCG